MFLATLQRTSALLRASARGQLLLLAPSVLLLAFPMLDLTGEFADLSQRAALTATFALVMVGLSARVSVRSMSGYDTMLSDLPGDVMLIAPRLLVQGVLAGSPLVIAWVLALALGGAAPLLGVLLFVLLVPLSLLGPVPVLLVAAAVAGGDRRWVPSVALLRLRTAPLRTSMLMLVPVAAATAALVPLLVVASVLAASTGVGAPVAFVGAAGLLVPLVGCGARGAWLVLDGDEIVRADHAAHAAGDDGIDLEAAFESLQSAAAAVEWTEGPSWDVAVDAGAVWGTWVRMPQPAQVALRVTWHGGPPPALAVADPSGTWRQPGDPASSGAAVAVALPAGDSYLQLASRATTGAQAISVTMLLPTVQAA